MKHNYHLFSLRLCCLALLGMLALLPARADTTAYGVEAGFQGSPLLATHGYQADRGDFELAIGDIDSVRNIVDSNPNNYYVTNGIEITLLLSDLIHVYPDPSASVQPGPIPVGTEVGFVISPDAAGISALSVDVLNFTQISFLDQNGNKLKKNGTVCMVQGKQSGETSLIGLNIGSVDKRATKVVCNIPEGLSGDVYGIGFGLAGVQVDAGQIRVHYAFVDNFKTVPITRRYFRHCSGKTAGMATGGKYLCNTDTTDGATTAVLQIGPVDYYVQAYTPLDTETRGSVTTQKEFPAGTEIGFVIKGGTALDLSLGGVKKLETLDANGNPVEEAKTINAVGLQVAGGGETLVSMITTQPCCGVHFKDIVGLELNLGAQVVKYAYVRLPQYPPLANEFSARLEVIPHIKPDGNTSNQMDNTIHLYNPDDNFLRVDGDYWSNKVLSFNGVLVASKKVTLVVARTWKSKDNDDADVYGVVPVYQIDIFKPDGNHTIKTDDTKENLSKNHYYYQITQEHSTKTVRTGVVNQNSDGTLDLRSISFNEGEAADKILVEADKNIFKYPAQTEEQTVSYALYFMPKTVGWDDVEINLPKNLDKSLESEGNLDRLCMRLATDGVITPQSDILYCAAGYDLANEPVLGETAGDDLMTAAELAQKWTLPHVVIPSDFENKLVPYHVSVYQCQLADTPRENKGHFTFTNTVVEGAHEFVPGQPRWSYSLKLAGQDPETKTDADFYQTPEVKSLYSIIIPYKVPITDAAGNYQNDVHYFTEMECAYSPSYLAKLQARYGDFTYSDGQTEYQKLQARIFNNASKMYSKMTCPLKTAPDYELPTATYTGQTYRYKLHDSDTNYVVETNYTVTENDAARLEVSDEKKVNQWFGIATTDPTPNQSQNAPRRAISLASLFSFPVDADLTTRLNEAVNAGDADAQEGETEVQGANALTGTYENKTYDVKVYAHTSETRPYQMGDVVHTYVPVRSLYTPDGRVSYLVAEAKAENTFPAADSILTGIEGLGADDQPEAEYYNMQGLRVVDPEPGFYIEKRGGTARVVRISEI